MPAPFAGTPPTKDQVNPTAPGTPVVTNAAANETATVTVSASTDNVGVVGYAAFLDGGPKEWARSATTAIQLKGVPAGQHSVVVRAFDAAGNYSDPSATAAFAIPNWFGVSATLAAPKIAKRLTAIVAGNSIASAMSFSSPSYSWRSEQNVANWLAGNVLEFPEITPTTRSDKYGCYGYGGATLATINADIEAQLFTPVVNAGVTPDIILALALLENDVANGRTYDQIVSDVQSFIAICRARFPGIKIGFGCCRPSMTIDSPAKLEVYRRINAYMQSLDNGVDVLTYKTDAYEDPNTPGKPKRTQVIGTITANVLTVSKVVSGDLIRLGDYYTGAGVYVSQILSGSGGVGTYQLTGAVADVPSPQTIYIDGWVDAVVHPTPRGGMLNGSVLAKMLKRLGVSAVSPFNATAGHALIGSQAATGTNVTGTVPAGVSTASSANTSACFAEALNPGLRLTYSAISDSAVQTDLAQFALLDQTFPQNQDALKGWVRFKIISGAEYLRDVVLRPRLNDNGVLGAATDFVVNGASSGDGYFQDGQEFYITTPVLRSSGGAMFSRGLIYLLFRARARVPVGAVIQVEIVGVGYEMPHTNKGLATLVAGTATVTSCAAKILDKTKIKLGVKTPGGTPGAVFVAAKTVGTSFVISSTNAADASIVAWELDNE